jgi:fibronectin-binding autotransporter adhesin
MMRARLTGLGWGAGSRTLTVLPVAAFILMAMLMPSVARASGCDKWTSTSSGSWFEGAHWSTKAPPTASEEACITEPGTYTVTMTQTGSTGTVTVKSLTVGAATGTQTLVVSGSNSLNASVTAASGIVVNATGAVKLTNVENEGNSVTIVAPVTNAGMITTEVGVGGYTRTFQGSLKNTGTLAIDTNTTFNGESAALTNEGTLDIAEGQVLTVSNKGSFTNGTGGKIAATGSGAVRMESGTSFVEAAGTTTGTEPVIVDDAALNYTGAGASAIVLRGASKLSGNISNGQALVIQGTNAENATTTAATGFSNAGAITLTQIENEGNNSTLAITSGALENTGTITAEAGTGSGTRLVQGNLTNKGTLAAHTSIDFNGSGAVLTNAGALDIAAGATFLLPNGQTASNEAGGTIVATGTGLFEQRSGTFNQGAGTNTGTDLVLDDGTLNYTGTGASAIVLRGASKLSGNIANGQALVIQGTNAENATTTAASGFSNAGAITLTQIQNEGNSATLAITTGTLENTGTITAETGEGSGTRILEGSLSNKGTVAADTSIDFNGSAAVLTNAGALDIAAGATFLLPNGQTFSNEAGGTIVATGTGLFEQRSGGTFNQGAGTNTGTDLVLDDGTLNYTGTGASAIVLQGSSKLSGNIAHGQALVIEGTNSENALTTAASGFSNAGSITLTQIQNEGDNSTLAITTGTLVNKATITVEQGPGSGTRRIEANVANEKSLIIGAGATLTITGTYTQTKKAILQTTIAGSSDFGQLSVTGAATISGTLTIVQGKPFTPKKGESFLVLSSSKLTGKYKVKGGKIAKTKPKLSYKATYSPTAVTLVVS